MSDARFARQTDLFDPQSDLFRRSAAIEDAEPPPADFIERIRSELQSTLATVQAAPKFPWRDMTQTLLAEMRFKSIAEWLPDEEAAELRTAFASEMTRLYAAWGDA